MAKSYDFFVFRQKKRDGRLPVSPYVLAIKRLALDGALIVDRDDGGEVGSTNIAAGVVADGDLAVEHILHHGLIVVLREAVGPLGAVAHGDLDVVRLGIGAGNEAERCDLADILVPVAVDDNVGEGVVGRGIEALHGGGDGQSLVALDGGGISALAGGVVGDDGSLLAFGHPFMQRGDSNYFLERAWILASLPNLQSAYKVGNLGATIGTVTQDRSAGIAAQIGAPPKVIPMYVSVTDSSRGVNGSARTELIDDDALLPSMVDAVTYNTVTRVADREGGGTARFNFRIDGRSAGGEQIKIQRENMYYADAGILKMISQELVQAATLLAQNKFEKIDVYNIEANVVLGTEPEVAEIISARPQKLNVRAGEELAIDVELQPYRAEKFTRTVKFTVPKQQRPGKMALNVRGGSSLAWMQELMKRQQEEGIPAAKKPQRRTLKDFIADINNADQNNEIIVDIAALPDPDMAAQQQDTGFAAALAGTPAKQKTTMNFIVDGTADIMVEVTG